MHSLPILYIFWGKMNQNNWGRKEKYFLSDGVVLANIVRMVFTMAKV